MNKLASIWAVLLISSWAGTSLAEDHEEAVVPVEPVAEEGTAVDSSTTAQPEGQSDDQVLLGKLADFELDRGFYITAVPFGASLSLGGEAGTSSAQPHWSLFVGYDLGKTISLQGGFSGFYILNNPIDAANINVSNSYSLSSIGGEAVIALRPAERWAIEPRFGGGITTVYPEFVGFEPSLLYAGGGLDIEYLTLMTGFSAGASITANYVLDPGVTVLGIGAMVRYTL